MLVRIVGLGLGSSCICIYMCIYIYICIYMYIYIYMYICIYMWFKVCPSRPAKKIEICM